jgi:hypothetical protein
MAPSRQPPAACPPAGPAIWRCLHALDPTDRGQQMQADKPLVGSNAVTDPSPCSRVRYSMQVSVFNRLRAGAEDRGAGIIEPTLRRQLESLVSGKACLQTDRSGFVPSYAPACSLCSGSHRRVCRPTSGEDFALIGQAFPMLASARKPPHHKHQPLTDLRETWYACTCKDSVAQHRSRNGGHPGNHRLTPFFLASSYRPP